MYTKIRRFTALFIVLTLLLTMLPHMAAAGTVPDGTYSVNYRYVKDGTADTSVANDYAVANTGKLIISGGKASFQHEFKGYSFFQHFSVRGAGSDKAVIVGETVTADGYMNGTAAPAGDGSDPNHVVISYEIIDIYTKQDVLIHIVIPALNYDHWYNLQLELDTSALPVDNDDEEGAGNVGAVTLAELQALIAEANNLLSGTTEGPGDGFYRVGSKTAFQLSIDQANSIVAGGGSNNPELVRAAYIIVLEGKKAYESARITVNKSILQRTIADSQSFAGTVKNQGTADGDAKTHGVISDGEYPIGSEVIIANAIAAAQQTADNVQATQAEVNAALEALAAKVEDLKKQQFKAQTFRLIVIDPDTNELSPYAGEFKEQVTLMTNAGAPYYRAYSQIAFAEPKDSVSLKLYGPNANGGIASNTLAGYVTKITKGYEGLNQAYQLSARHSNADDSIYQGLSRLEYTVGDGPAKTVLLSYNALQFDALNNKIAEARSLYDASVEGTGEGQFAPAVRASLLAAIEQAEQASAKLAATRPELNTSASALEQALLPFRTGGDAASLKAAIAEAQAAHDEAIAGTGAGQYPQASKDALSAAISEAAAVAGNVFASAQTLTNTEQALRSALAQFRATQVKGDGGGTVNPTDPAGLADGQYNIDFIILKKGTSQTSVMNEYAAHPGRLIVRDGVKYVQILLKQSKEITGLTIGGSTPSTVESDSAANTRRVQFVVDDLSTKLSGWVKIDWPEVDYHHQYDVDIQLGAYTPASSWGSEEFGPIIDRDNPDAEGEQEEGEELETPSFTDTASHWALEAIQRAVKLGIVKGYPNGSFKPDATVSRAEWTIIVSRALKLEAGTQTSGFSDQGDIPSWALPLIQAAFEAGMINGYEDQSFRPNKNVSRAEIAVMVVRALNLPLEDESTLDFADTEQIPAYARSYVATAVKHGLINGLGNNRFGANQPATRAEAVTLVLRAADYLNPPAEESDDSEAGES